MVTFKERFVNVAGMMKLATDETLNYYKYAALGFIVIVLIGGWWYLKFRLLSMGLLFLAILFLAWVAFEQSGRGKEKPKKGKNKKDPPAFPDINEILGDVKLNTSLTGYGHATYNRNNEIDKEIRKLTKVSI